MTTVRVRINRALRKSGAQLIHDSLWRHDDINVLIDLALLIKRVGGRASVLEEKFVFE